MSRTIPTINTQRLTLRGMRPEDFRRYAEIWAMPDVVARINDAPWPKSKAWDAFLRNAGHWQITGFGQWAVQRHGVPDMSGQVGFFYAKRDLGEDFDSYPEAGWVLEPGVHGKGLGMEAARAAHDWFDRVVTGHLVCMIAPEHKASLRIAEAMGYQVMRDADYSGSAVRLLARKGPPQ
ncbi:N-acetyltransferase [Roseobacter cerasinus]|uniref:N-acetyltransferase n=1 Tax=Roseobacter cerasinus TaxID=2602289 RepID=A0A640VN35_9RHOB|nr:GNAT family N-acetyltransferase [Roseobacter cerasinus]GFE49878.1 N-acetyltransferase [Roseobacter cerasinus]